MRSSLSYTYAQSHSVDFSLPTPRVTGRVQDEETLVKRLDFHLVLANKPQDTKGKEHSSWVWDELVLRLAEIPMKVCTTAVLSAATDAAAKKPRFVRVKFLDNDTTEPVIRTSSPLDRGESTANRGFEASHQIITNPFGRIPPPQRETRQLVQVKDICRTLSGKRPDVEYQDPYGYLLDETTQRQQKFDVYRFRSSYDNDECATIHLRDVFSQRNRPSLARRYHITATAASSVLFMQNTLWMPVTLTIKDVFLVSRHGNVDYDEIYLAKKSLHGLEGSISAPSHDSSSEAAGVSTLYYLGIFLMDVMLWKPVYEFWDDEGFSRIEAILKRIEWISSPEFREVAGHRIKCDLNANSLSLDDDTFRQAIYNDIVLPLQDADRLAGRKMTTGKGKLARTA
ncbi:hypothetical protein HD806DRAFT_536036 [Xylariaceae sp. AK1471]|nr:hypothetical protein HD806DRAFT_536036 [Xylariaceae sp. AK1471]